MEIGILSKNSVVAESTKRSTFRLQKVTFFYSFKVNRALCWTKAEILQMDEFYTINKDVFEGRQITLWK